MLSTFRCLDRCFLLPFLAFPLALTMVTALSVCGGSFKSGCDSDIKGCESSFVTY